MTLGILQASVVGMGITHRFSMPVTYGVASVMAKASQPMLLLPLPQDCSHSLGSGVQLGALSCTEQDGQQTKCC